MVSSWSRARAGTVLVALSAVLLITMSQARIGTAAASNAVEASAHVAIDRPSLRTQGGIAAEAGYLSNRKLTVVCAQTAKEWAQALTAAGLPSAQTDEYYGFSLIPEGVMHLSPYVCEGLRLGSIPSLRASKVLQVGWAVDVLVHESVHMGRFTDDEALAEACARAGLPAELSRLYGISYHSAEMSSLTLAAASFRVTQDRVYRGGTCSAAP